MTTLAFISEIIVVPDQKQSYTSSDSWRNRIHYLVSKANGDSAAENPTVHMIVRSVSL